MMQELKDMTTANGKPETTFEEMLNAIGDSLSNLASSDDKQDGEAEEDDENDSELGKLSDDDEPGWVMGTISKTLQQGRMERFQQNHIRLDELTQLGWEDLANYCGERDMKYGTDELKVPVVVSCRIDTTATSAYPTTGREHTHTVDIVRVQLEMPAVNSQTGSSQMRLGSELPQSFKYIPNHVPDAATNSTPMHDAKPVEPVSFDACMKHP